MSECEDQIKVVSGGLRPHRRALTVSERVGAELSASRDLTPAFAVVLHATDPAQYTIGTVIDVNGFRWRRRPLVLAPLMWLATVGCGIGLAWVVIWLPVYFPTRFDFLAPAVIRWGVFIVVATSLSVVLWGVNLTTWFGWVRRDKPSVSAIEMGPFESWSWRLDPESLSPEVRVLLYDDQAAIHALREKRGSSEL